MRQPGLMPALLLSLLLPTAVSAQAVFLTSEPPRAEVVLDGVVLENLTPVLLTDLDPGRTYRAEVRRNGYLPATVDLTAAADSATVRSLNLEPEHVFGRFETTPMSAGDLSPEEGEMGLPAGNYRLLPENTTGGYRAVPEWQGQRWLDTIERALPFTIGVTALLSVAEFTRHTQGQDPDYSYIAVAWGVNLALLGTDVALQFRRDGWRRQWEPSLIERDPASERFWFEKGEDALSGGDFGTARDAFAVILDTYPDSPYYASVLYRSGRLAVLMGDRETGRQLLETLCRERPVPEFYDRSCRVLADMAAARGEVEEALVWLDRITYVNDDMSRQEVDRARSRLKASSQPQ